MNTKVLTTLEYNKIIDLLTEKADSEPGKKLCRDLVPSTDLSAIRTAQRETKDALARLFRVLVFRKNDDGIFFQMQVNIVLQ